MSATNTYLLISMALKENPTSATSYILKSLSQQTYHHKSQDPTQSTTRPTPTDSSWTLLRTLKSEIQRHHIAKERGPNLSETRKQPKHSNSNHSGYSSQIAFKKNTHIHTYPQHTLCSSTLWKIELWPLEVSLANLLDFLSTELELVLLLLLNLAKRIFTFGNTPLQNSTDSLVSCEVFFLSS